MDCRDDAALRNSLLGGPYFRSTVLVRRGRGPLPHGARAGRGRDHSPNGGGTGRATVIGVASRVSCRRVCRPSSFLGLGRRRVAVPARGRRRPVPPADAVSPPPPSSRIVATPGARAARMRQEPAFAPEPSADAVRGHRRPRRRLGRPRRPRRARGSGSRAGGAAATPGPCAVARWSGGVGLRPSGPCPKMAAWRYSAFEVGTASTTSGAGEVLLAVGRLRGSTRSRDRWPPGWPARRITSPRSSDVRSLTSESPNLLGTILEISTSSSLSAAFRRIAPLPSTIGGRSFWFRPKTTTSDRRVRDDVDHRRALGVDDVEGERVLGPRPARGRRQRDRHRVGRLVRLVLLGLGVVEHADLAQRGIVRVERPQGVEGAVADLDVGLVHQLAQLHVRRGLVHRRQRRQRVGPELGELDRRLAQGLGAGGVVEVGQGLGREEPDLGVRALRPASRALGRRWRPALRAAARPRRSSWDRAAPWPTSAIRCARSAGVSIMGRSWTTRKNRSWFW